jgi:hypothetical protein
MKSNFSNLLLILWTMALLANPLSTNAMDPTNQEDYFKKIGLDAKPLKITIRDDIKQKCISEFDDFQKSRSKYKNESSDYMIIKSYILNILKIQQQDFSQIENWISKPAKTPPHTERFLSLPLDILAGLLSTKMPTAITSSEIEAYLKQSNEKLKAAQRFDTLKYFATKVLQLNPTDLEPVFTI